MFPRILAVCLYVTTAVAAQAVDTAPLERLKYNHPGLVVDLGAGLWAWPLPMDFDGDGDFDLLVSCPDRPYNGLWFFENARGDTATNKMPVFKPARRVSQGLQNVQVSFVDGQPRVLSPGNEYPAFQQTGFGEPKKLPLPENIHSRNVRANTWRYVDYDGDGALDLVVGVGDGTDYGWDNAYDPSGKWTNGPLHGFVYVVRNSGTTAQPAYAKPELVLAGDRPVDVYAHPLPNFADFDDDGDLDLLCGEFLDGFTYFENVGTRTAPKYANGRRLKTPDGKPLVMDLQMITPTALDWDKDGDVDLIVGDEDGRVAFVENTGQLAADRSPRFKAPRYFPQEADNLKCGALASPAGCDWDGDGDWDIVSGNTAGYLVFFENLSGPGVEKPRWAGPKSLEANGKVIRIQAGPNGSIQGPCEAKWGYTTLSVADWDGDSLPDLVVNSIWGKVQWYRNVGTHTRPKLAAAQPLEVEWNGPQPLLAYGWLRPEGKALLTQWRTTPVVVDWNKDGLADLVMLDQEGFLTCFERARVGHALVLRAPQRVFHGENFSVADRDHKILDRAPGPLRLNSGLAGRSGRRKLCITDWDGDGRLDVLVNSANANLLRQTQARDGKFCFRDLGSLSQQGIEGHDVSPTIVDFNNDSVPDYLGGAEDGHFYYLRNPRSR